MRIVRSTGSHLRKRAAPSSMRTRGSCLTQSILRRKSGSFFWASARHSGFWSYVTVTGRRTMSYESFPPERQIGRSNVSIVGGSDEETLRLFQIRSESYLRKAKKQLTIRLDEDTIDYFRALAEKNGVPYQNLINLYLRDCAQSARKLSMKWE